MYPRSASVWVKNHVKGRSRVATLLDGLLPRCARSLARTRTKWQLLSLPSAGIAFRNHDIRPRRRATIRSLSASSVRGTLARSWQRVRSYHWSAKSVARAGRRDDDRLHGKNGHDGHAYKVPIVRRIQAKLLARGGG